MLVYDVCCVYMWVVCLLCVCVECIYVLCEGVHMRNLFIKVVQACVGFTEGHLCLFPKDLVTVTKSPLNCLIFNFPTFTPSSDIEFLLLSD